MKIHAYLNFGGKAEEAMRFYAKVLGGKLSEIHRFSAMPVGADLNLTHPAD
jgi:PhnB protein